METPYLVCIDTVFEGRVSAVHDAQGSPVVFSSLREAQREIAENLIDRLQEFIDGHREFEEAVGLDEFALPVSIGPDKVIVDCDGNCYS